MNFIKGDCILINKDNWKNIVIINNPPPKGSGFEKDGLRTIIF